MQPTILTKEVAALYDGLSQSPVDETHDCAVFRLNSQGLITTWNSAAQHLTGYAAQEITGKHISILYAGIEDVEDLSSALLLVASKSGISNGECWSLKKDRSRWWANVVITPSFNLEGQTNGFTHVVRDLTEDQATRENLKRSEAQFRLLVEGVADYAIYLLDIEGKITSWNLGAQRIKGYSPEEILGQHFSRFLTREDQDAGEDRRALSAVLRDGAYEKEAWRIRKDGTRFWANIVIQPILATNGAVVGFAKITRDITDRREALLALDKTRAALFQSQKLEALGKLTGGVAHDFNNLLGAVLGSLEIARKLGADRPRLNSLIENAVDAARRGAALTTRMLAFTRQQELKSESVNVMVLVAGMTRLLQQSLGPAISIRTSFPLTISLVRADANQLELALLNLAVNARDAMPDGGEITIAAREENVTADRRNGLAAARYVCLSVIDTGIGMDEATLMRATEPFFTTKDVGKGTGLGLSVVHGMLEQLGGRLILHSREGSGTTSEIWLPIASPFAENQVGMPTASPSAKPHVRPLAVLLVDDDSLVLKSTAALLEDLGHTVLEASSGWQALEILRGDASVDLVITDHGMPQMTGFELILALREEFPSLPIVLASGYAELPPAVAVSVPKLGKPYGQSALAAAITMAVQTRSFHQVV